MLINVKMPTIVGILTLICMIISTSERLKAINFFICPYYSFYEQVKFRAQLSWARKKFYYLGARPFIVCCDQVHIRSSLIRVHSLGFRDKI